MCSARDREIFERIRKELILYVKNPIIVDAWKKGECIRPLSYSRLVEIIRMGNCRTIGFPLGWLCAACDIKGLAFLPSLVTYKFDSRRIGPGFFLAIPPYTEPNSLEENRSRLQVEQRRVMNTPLAEWEKLWEVDVADVWSPWRK